MVKSGYYPSLRFLETNILLDFISRNPTEIIKHKRAVGLIGAGNKVPSVQVLQEVYVPTTRPNRLDPLPRDIVAGPIRTWLRFRVQEISVPLMTGARGLVKNGSLFEISRCGSLAFGRRPDVHPFPISSLFKGRSDVDIVSLDCAGAAYRRDGCGLPGCRCVATYLSWNRRQPRSV